MGECPKWTRRIKATRRGSVIAENQIDVNRRKRGQVATVNARRTESIATETEDGIGTRRRKRAIKVVSADVEIRTDKGSEIWDARGNGACEIVVGKIDGSLGRSIPGGAKGRGDGAGQEIVGEIKLARVEFCGREAGNWRDSARELISTQIEVKIGERESGNGA